jgi:hypothetical protein
MAEWLEREEDRVWRVRRGWCVEEKRVEMEELMGRASGVGESKRVGTAQMETQHSSRSKSERLLAF